MTVLQKLLAATVSSATALLVLGTLGIDSAQAALLKFIFEGEGVNGYFIYDDAALGTQDSPNSTIYYEGGYDYKFDFGDLGVFEGTVGNPIVFLRRSTDDPGSDIDGFIWEVRASQRQPASDYAFLGFFQYPEDTFGGSLAIPTSVPETATLEVTPYVDFPNNNLGDVLYRGTVKTRIVKVPEPTLMSASVVMGSCFVLRRLRRRQAVVGVTESVG